jgi:hypothetical protein
MLLTARLLLGVWLMVQAQVPSLVLSDLTACALTQAWASHITSLTSVSSSCPKGLSIG